MRLWNTAEFRSDRYDPYHLLIVGEANGHVAIRAADDLELVLGSRRRWRSRHEVARGVCGRVTATGLTEARLVAPTAGTGDGTLDRTRDGITGNSQRAGTTREVNRQNDDDDNSTSR